MANPLNPFFNSFQDLGLKSLNSKPFNSQPFSQPFSQQFNEGPSSTLSTSLNIPEDLGMASMPLGNESAQNSAQSAQKQQSNLQKAFDDVQSLYSPMGGRPISGSEDVKVKVDAYGRPYTVVSMTPTDAQGRSQKTETMSFGISPEQKASSVPTMGTPQGQVAAGTKLKYGGKEVYNPFAQQNEAQMQEYNRRKQISMS